MYFLDYRRIAEQPYLTRLLAILRHPVGKLLLDSLTDSAPLLSALLQMSPLPPGLEARPRLHAAPVQLACALSAESSVC